VKEKECAIISLSNINLKKLYTCVKRGAQRSQRVIRECRACDIAAVRNLKSFECRLRF
jgi:hypothetical protein